MAQEVEDRTEVLGVAVYQESPTLILGEKIVRQLGRAFKPYIDLSNFPHIPSSASSKTFMFTIHDNV